MTAPFVPQIALYRNWLRRAARPFLRDLRGACGNGRCAISTAFWRSIWDYYDLQSPTPFAAVHHRAQDAGRGLVSRRTGQLCAAGVPACGRRRCGRPARDRQQAARTASSARRAGRSCGARSAALALHLKGQGHQAGRPHRGLPAQHPRNHHRVSGERQHRRGLERLCARHGRARGDRPLQADRAEGADRLRCRHLCRAPA